MARISTYTFDQNVTKNDFVIGSDYATNFTRNYKLENLAKFFGTQQATLGDKFAYIYDQSSDYSSLSTQAASFNNRSQVNTQFSGITEIYVYKYNDLNVDVTTFFNSVYENAVLKLNNGYRTTDYGIYRVQGVESIPNDVLKISVDLLLSNGTITDGETIVFSAGYQTDKHFKTTLMDGDVWVIEHNLGKFPSISIVDTANNVIYGEIQYNDLNNVTISFGSPVIGYAYFN